jgi:hypothetical protein
MDEMGGACGANGREEERIYKFLEENPEGKKSLQRLRRRWVDNIKAELGEI